MFLSGTWLPDVGIALFLLSWEFRGCCGDIPSPHHDTDLLFLEWNLFCPCIMEIQVILLVQVGSWYTSCCFCVHRQFWSSPTIFASLCTHNFETILLSTGCNRSKIFAGQHVTRCICALLFHFKVFVRELSLCTPIMYFRTKFAIELVIPWARLEKFGFAGWKFSLAIVWWPSRRLTDPDSWVPVVWFIVSLEDSPA